MKLLCINFLRSAYLPFGIGCTSFMLALYFFLFIFVAIFFFIDSFKRYKEYRLVKDMLQDGWNDRVAWKMRRSACQRIAFIAAALETNNYIQAKEYYQRLGYRWYHIIPDPLVKRPMLFFTYRYWKAIFKITF